ncbi:guanylate kinase-like [Neoarius graeffei]|uniref:guanylate kinase-like n=1 Tax=Neoarius graeffei TaxID=443677 RepID=UPI00298C905D|nr:guanylate kinase-like [Neoarius graeffei]
MSKAAVQAVQAQNLICILVIDMQGVKSIKRTNLNPVYVSIQPPSMDVLVRQTESEDSLQMRLQAALMEMEFSKEAGQFDVVIVNDNLDEAYEKLKAALLQEIQKFKNTTKA